MAKVRAHVEVGLVGLAPRAIELVRERGGVRDDAEEVHPPHRALRLAVVDVEEAERDARGRGPEALGLVQGGGGRQPVNERGGDIESVKGSACGANLQTRMSEFGQDVGSIHILWTGCR